MNLISGYQVIRFETYEILIYFYIIPMYGCLEAEIEQKKIPPNKAIWSVLEGLQQEMKYSTAVEQAQIRKDLKWGRQPGGFDLGRWKLLEKNTEYFLKSGDSEVLCLKHQEAAWGLVLPIPWGNKQVTLHPYSRGELRKRCLVHIGDATQDRVRRKIKLKPWVKLGQTELCNESLGL